MNRLFFVFALIFSLSASAQAPEKKKTFTVYLSFPTHSVKAEVMQKPSRGHGKTQYTYSWYAANKIEETQGGYDGKLLHGWYTATYPDNNLKEKGRYCKGMRCGEWMSWHTNGKVFEKTHYSGGQIHGKYERYDMSGNLTIRASYRHGKLSGHFYSYDSNGKVTDHKLYKNGTEKPVKQKAGKPVSPKVEKPDKQKAEKPATRSDKSPKTSGKEKKSFHLFPKKEKK